MRKLTLLLVACMLLTLCACNAVIPPFITDAPTPAPTEMPTETPTEATEASTEPAAIILQPMDLVGTWQSTHTEIEGERIENTNATITISGVAEDRLIITYEDKEFPDTDFKEKALTISQGELYYDCGNDRWVAEVADTGTLSYRLTLLSDGTLILQHGFDYDGQPMVSHQWFTRK